MRSSAALFVIAITSVTGCSLLVPGVDDFTFHVDAGPGDAAVDAASRDSSVGVPDDAGDGGACGDCPTGQRCRPDGMCVECTSTADCTDGRVCDVVPGDCVECFEDTACPALRPTCEANSCASGCTAPRCAARFPGQPYRDEESGACVQCARATEATDCDGTSCHPDTRTCTTTPLASLGLCEPCVSDSECGTFDVPGTPAIETVTLRCVPTEFRPAEATAPVPAGSYCLPQLADPTRDDCFAGVPRREGGILSAAIDPVPGFYCLPIELTTCAALLDEDPCMPGSSDDECGLRGEPDGLCSGGRCRALCSPTEPASCPDSEMCQAFDIDGTAHFCSP